MLQVALAISVLESSSLAHIVSFALQLCSALLQQNLRFSLWQKLTEAAESKYPTMRLLREFVPYLHELLIK